MGNVGQIIGSHVPLNCLCSTSGKSWIRNWYPYAIFTWTHRLNPWHPHAAPLHPPDQLFRFVFWWSSCSQPPMKLLKIPPNINTKSIALHFHPPHPLTWYFLYHHLPDHLRPSHSYAYIPTLPKSPVHPTLTLHQTLTLYTLTPSPRSLTWDFLYHHLPDHLRPWHSWRFRPTFLGWYLSHPFQTWFLQNKKQVLSRHSTRD